MSNPDLIELIEESGHNFHYKVVVFLRNQGWNVDISPYYNDNFTDKPREIDIIAEKEYEIRGSWGDKWIGSINVRLFIECKYIANETVFIFDNKNLTRVTERILRDTPLKDPGQCSITTKHRYFKEEKVAKLFVSNSKRSSDNEVVYKALTQSLNAMVAYKKHPSIIPRNKNLKYNLLANLDYPVIVCDSLAKLHAYDFLTKKIDQLTQKFQLEVNYAYLDSDKNTKTDYFLIDVADFNNLGILIKEIEDADVNAVREKLNADDQAKPRSQY